MSDNKQQEPAQLNAKIPADLDRRLEIYCIFSTKKKKHVVAAAIAEYLEKHDAQGEAQ